MPTSIDTERGGADGEAGSVTSYIVKPFTPISLKAKLVSVLGEFQLTV